jgi:hypothetical protein
VDFAIAPSPIDGDAEGWDVVCLRIDRGTERPLRLASFGYRTHAEAFLQDLLTNGASVAHA